MKPMARLDENEEDIDDIFVDDDAEAGTIETDIYRGFRQAIARIDTMSTISASAILGDLLKLGEATPSICRMMPCVGVLLRIVPMKSPMKVSASRLNNHE